MKEKGFALVILVLLMVSTSACARPIYSQGTGPQIDLYTQREPYSGRGLNVPSDSFGPGEEVEIFAYVAYNDYPMHGALVAYAIVGPCNSSQGMVFYRSALTDENGPAVINFRVSYLEEESFGNWTVIGNTEVAGSIVSDTVFFRVGWLVEIVSARTLNRTNETQTIFALRSIVCVELILKSIAMTEKSITISMMVNDSLNMRVASTAIDNFVVPPNGILVASYSCFSILDQAHLGFAAISAGLYTAPLTEGGTAYSPEILVRFLIVTRDVAVINVIPSTQYAFIDNLVNVSVTVKNLGLFSESFDVTLLANSTVAGTLPVTNLETGAQQTLIFLWDTHGFEQGTYTLSALAVQVQDEINTANNLYTDGVVELRVQPANIGSSFVFEWWQLLLLLLLLLLVIILTLLLYRRRRKREKNVGGSFDAAWSAWYYGYSPSSGRLKT